MSSRFFSTATYSDSDDSSEDELLLSSSEEELVSSSEEENNLSSEEENDLDDDDEEEDDDDDEDWGSDSDDDSSDDDSGAKSGPAYFLKSNNFLKGDDSDSDEDSDDEKKVVKSAKDKYLDEIDSAVDKIENYSMVHQWVDLFNEFDKLNRLALRAPQYHISIPAAYIKSIADLDNVIRDVTESEKEGDNKKKMNASESKSFNIVKQRVRKAVKEYQSEVSKYLADPEHYGEVVEKVPEVTENVKKTPAGEADDIFETLRSIIETRGKKNVDLNEQIESLVSLLETAKTPFQLISIYLILIPVRFDLYAKASFMPLEQWKSTTENINSLLTILETNKEYVVTENAVAADDIQTEPEADSNGVKKIVGSIASLIERLDDEFTSHLQNIDPHSSEYIQRVRDDITVYALIVRTQIYYENVIPEESYESDEASQLFRIILRRLDHIYYKPTKLINFTETQAWKNLGESVDSKIYKKADVVENESVNSAGGLFDKLCSLLYKQPNSIFRKKTVLYHIYYYAFNDQYYKARDMLLMSHLQSTIHTSDPQLQVLFNRALVQLGFSAFRSGLFVEAQQSLQEIATSSRQREILGQSVQRFQQQQSQVDKQRLLPFHMHINLELLECCFHTASLLIEIPFMAASPEVAKKRQTSAKSFKRALEYHERQIFEGPAENTRDYIMYAAKALQKSDWKKASELLDSIKIWSLFGNTEELKKMLRSKLQVEALRTYLFVNKNFYDSLSIKNLTEIFELSESEVRSIISKMIYQEELNAALDQKTGSVTFVEGVEMTRLQELALSLADKCNQMAERNERLAAGGHQNLQLVTNTNTNNNNNQNNNNQNKSYNNNNNNNGANNNNGQHNTKLNFKSTPGTISGALNGMRGSGRRHKKNPNHKPTKKETRA
ncbi:hypothetical protein B5S28_g3137 [[Candida] boidinii]|nr:hypothetical protein B5S28_g3137 [[Candida] boidinii]